jgi:DNA mismatch repair protein MutS
VHAGFAEVAAEQRYVRPTLCDQPIVRLRGCRHPVVEQSLPPGTFVANDIHLVGELPSDSEVESIVAEDEVPAAQILLVTGPNMAGKSTLMRQVALAAILAQAGGFVPAQAATLGVLDAVLTRIGAGDDISEGASTFMVEMRETADLLARATPRTLVLLDEIGRGTSTWDGLAIAWSVTEALHEKRALTLFATHYHELTALSERLPRLRNVHVAVREWGHDIVFIHRLQPGPTSRSHGIAVARLAGLPAPVVARARDLLQRFEANQRTELAAPRRQLGLFDAAPAEPVHGGPQAHDNDAELLELARKLDTIQPDDLSPREAHGVLVQLCENVRDLPELLRQRLQAGGEAQPIPRGVATTDSPS